MGADGDESAGGSNEADCGESGEEIEYVQSGEEEEGGCWDATEEMV